MDSYNLTDARRNLPDIVTAAESGADTEITRRGKAVAVVISTADYALLVETRRPSIGELHDAFIAKHGPLDLPEDWLDGVRDKSPGRTVDFG